MPNQYLSREVVDMTGRQQDALTAYAQKVRPELSTDQTKAAVIRDLIDAHIVGATTGR